MPSEPIPRAGVWWATASAVSFAGLDVAIKYFGDVLTAWQMVLGRGVLGVGFCLVAGRLLGLDLLGRGRGFLLLVGAVGATATTMITASVRLGRIAEALALFYLFPAWAALLSPLVTGERTGGRDWLFIGLAFAGMLIVFWPDEAGGLHAGQILSVSAAFFYGLMLTMVRRQSAKNHAMTPFFYLSIFNVLVGLGAVWLGLAELGVDGRGGLGIVVVAAAAWLGQVTCNQALARLTSARVCVLLMLEVALGAAADAIIFGQALTARLMVGGGAVMLSGILLNLSGPGPRGER